MLKKIALILILALAIAVPSFVQAGSAVITGGLRRTDPPTITMQVCNTSGTGVTLAAGDVVVWDISTDANFGVDVTTTTTADIAYVAGVIDQTIAYNAYGRMIVYGYCSHVHVAGTVTAGDNIGTSTTAGKGATTTTANVTYATAMETGTTAIGAIVHCLGN